MKCFRFLLGAILIFNALICRSQTVPDITLSLHETTINKLLGAIGTIADTSEYKILFIKGKYNWQVNHARIELNDGEALFYADVRVETGPFSYSDHISGNMNVMYNPKTNKLILTLNSAKFAVKTKALGKEQVLSTIDLANFYKEPIEFDGPIAMEQDFEFEMPGGNMKRLKAVIKDCEIFVLDEKIDMKAVFDFVDVDLNEEEMPEPPKIKQMTDPQKPLSKKELRRQKKARKREARKAKRNRD